MLLMHMLDVSQYLRVFRSHEVAMCAITSAKEVMFLPVFVCLFVCLLFVR